LFAMYIRLLSKILGLFFETASDISTKEFWCQEDWWKLMISSEKKILHPARGRKRTKIST